MPMKATIFSNEMKQTKIIKRFSNLNININKKSY